MGIARYEATLPTLTDRDNTDLIVDVSGRLVTTGVNAAATVFASAAYGAGANNSSDLTNLYHTGVILFLDYTAESGTSPTLDVKVQGKDALSGKYYDITGAAFAQISAVGTATLTLLPSIVASANVAVSTAIPLTWRCVATVGGSATPTVTFTLGAQYIG